MDRHAKSADLIEQRESEYRASSEIQKGAIPLYPYQKTLIECMRQLIAAVMCRDAGKSFAATLKAALSMLRGNDWLLLSASTPQVRALMELLAVHLHAIGQVVDVMMEDVRFEDDSRFTVYRITLPNDAQAAAVTATPHTVRGYHRHVYGDEWAHVKNNHKVWAALYPTITRGKRLILTSTYEGQQDHFYQAMTDTTGRWEQITIDIHTALEQGLTLLDPETGRQVDAEYIRSGLGDEQAWQQEYLCLPSGGDSIHLAMDLILETEDSRAPFVPQWAEAMAEKITSEYKAYRTDHMDRSFAHLVHIPREGGRLSLGYDVARKQHWSVIQIDEDRSGTGYPVATIEMQNTPFWVQKKVLDALLRHPRMRHACIDNTGIGAQLAEEAQDIFGRRVEAVTATNATNADLARKLKTAMEERTTTIASHKRIRDSLHAVRRGKTAQGHDRYWAPESPDGSHADHFWAKALCVRAMGGRSGRAEFYSPSIRDSKGRIQRPGQPGGIWSSISQWMGVG